MSTELNPADMVWEDPPKPSAGRPGSAENAAIAESLREHPGRWAKVRTYNKSQAAIASTYAGYITHGTLVAFRGRGFEAVSRMVGDEAHVYARYVGTGDES